MKTAILMSLASPWSRKTATALAESSHEVHVIDFDTTRRGRGTVKTNDAFQLSAIQAFGKTVQEIHIHQTRYSSSLRYFTSVPAFRKLLKQIEPDVLLTLYGGGFANLALFSGFHPYAVYAVGSDVLLSKGIARRLGRTALARLQAE